MGNASLIRGFAFGSPLLLLFGNLSIYDEAIHWGTRLIAFFALRSREAEGYASLGRCLPLLALAQPCFRGRPWHHFSDCAGLHYVLRRNPVHNIAALFPLVAAFLFYLSEIPRFGFQRNTYLTILSGAADLLQPQLYGLTLRPLLCGLFLFTRASANCGISLHFNHYHDLQPPNSLCHAFHPPAGERI